MDCATGFASSELSVQVFFCPLVFWICKHVLGFVVFNQFSEIHKHRIIRDTGSLGHIVRDDENGEFVFQLQQEFFYPVGSYGIKGGCGFVH